MKLESIRDSFLKYFERHGHRIVPSSSLVPVGDDTLLFTNAGMVQFKDAFLGVDQGYKRATSAQRCVRAGGKHNDLENVGYTARHHTFFEMLGNFSFGDYFKKEAIYYAWNFLTQELKLPAEKLWITIYEEDQEAADIWLKDLNVSPDRFSRCGEKSNFWSMGDTGPCGPCTEIFYDHGPEIAGGPPGSPDEEGDRYVEIWNLVFMQYNRTADGVLHPLPKPSVDTGMGLERIAAVMQGVHTNYDIDLFKNIIDAIMALLKVYPKPSDFQVGAEPRATEVYERVHEDCADGESNTPEKLREKGITDRGHKSLCVIADHIRSCAFLIVDGILPSNEGRGYVLRRIIRRAVRHGHKLGATEPFFYQLVECLVAEMGAVYPELVKSKEHIIRVLRKEEDQFARTLAHGLAILEEDLKTLQGKEIAGSILFKLYDTYGFPVDLTADIARERGLTIDMPGFEAEMAQQRLRARQASQFGDADKNVVCEGVSSFVGYQKMAASAVITYLYCEGQAVNALEDSKEAILVTETTPFYAESGGQVGDKGVIRTADGSVFEVSDTRKMGSAIGHIGRLISGTLEIGNEVVLEVNESLRRQTMANHSATHLLHAALHQIVGKHVTQKGSLVNADRLRFDFSHFEALTAQELHSIETLVNDKIRENSEAVTKLMSVEEAMKKGAMALFGEKYGDEVRVLTLGHSFSIELCGGTHVQRTGDIGFFKIISEGGIASGVRRIEAVTGVGAFNWLTEQQQIIGTVCDLLKADPSLLIKKVEQSLDKQKQLEKNIDVLNQKLSMGVSRELQEKAMQIKNVSVVVEKVSNMDLKSMRQLSDELCQKLNPGIVVLGGIENERVHLLVSVTSALTTQISANDLVQAVAPVISGKGGGRKESAQAGGSDKNALEKALKIALDWIQEKLM